MSLTELELLTLDANALQGLLADGKVTSLSLVKQSLGQIASHDRQGATLRAMISIIPEDKLLTRASDMDRERAHGQLRGPFHGIPTIVKDSIKTSARYAVPTTVGTLSLAKVSAKKDATLIQKLEAAGAIIVGKTNLNELCGWKGLKFGNGWSAFGGQTQSAYVASGFDPSDGGMGHSNPCGSSTGSAVGVAAGYSPIAVGTETTGSLVSPATRAALYSIKPTIGSTLTEGCWTLSDKFDAVGGMARSVIDLTELTHLLQKDDDQQPATTASRYRQHLTGKFDGLRIGFLDPSIWQFSTEFCKTTDGIVSEMTTAYFSVMHKIASEEAAVTKFPVPLAHPSELIVNGTHCFEIILNNEYARHTAHFLADMENSPVRTLGDTIEFNRQHAAAELPEGHVSQQHLITAWEHPPSDESAKAAFDHLRTVARDNGIDKTLREHDFNLLAFPMDNFAFQLAAAAGYPVATMPLGVLKSNDRPFALGIMAQAGREDLMFQFMSAFERITPARQVPRRLLSGRSADRAGVVGSFGAGSREMAQL